MKHETVKYLLKNNEEIDIDIKILPVIKWLNSFDSILTEFSCQGGYNSNEGFTQKPYVSFTCDNNKDLISVLKLFKYGFGNLVVNLTINEIDIRYQLLFNSTKDLEVFTHYFKQY